MTQSLLAKNIILFGKEDLELLLQQDYSSMNLLMDHLILSIPFPAYLKQQMRIIM